MSIRAIAVLLAFVAAPLANAMAADAPAPQLQQFKHQVTGLCSHAREKDLREAFARLPNIKLLAIDFDRAEVSVEYDPKQVFPDAHKPEDIVEQFNNRLGDVSFRTFGIKPLCSIARDKLTLVEIGVAGLDCRACELAAYELIYRLPGVEQATADFKTGKMTALVDPAKIDRTRIEAVLKEREVQLVPKSDKK